MHLGAVDRQRGQRADASPMVLRIDRVESAPPDSLGLLETSPRPRNPAGKKQRPDDRPRIAQLFGRQKGPAQEPFRLVDIGLEVDRDVAKETKPERKSEGILMRFSQLDCAIQGQGGGGI